MAAGANGAEVILTGGRIRTLDGADRVVQALAIRDGRIVATGADDEITPLAGAGTRRVTLGGATVIPGLIDPHNHMLSTGELLRSVQLYDCRSIDDILARVRERVEAAPPGTWVVGRGWDESLLRERRYPTRYDLDRVAPEHPVVIHRVWNKLVANSRAIALAGISRETPDPPADVPYSGSFDRDEHGEPVGLFRDRAKALIADAMPAPTDDHLAGAIATACRAYNATGITTIEDPGLTPSQIRAYHLAHQRGNLTVRTEMMMAGWGFVPAAEEPCLEERFRALGVMGGFGDDRLRLAGIKLMPDGGMGDRTARMSQPYLDEPENLGTWVVPPDELAAHIRWVHDLGWAMDIHTCGDEAQAAAVRAFAAAQRAHPNPRLRHRVHHAYFPTEETLELMAAWRIPAMVSTPFIAQLGEGFVAAVGEERAARAMPMRFYLERGVPLAGSSDSTVAPFNPWFGMAAAITRRTVAGRVLGADQALTAPEALHLYTTGAAFALGREADLGALELGKRADLVVLDRDPLDPEMGPNDLAIFRPQRTMVGGEWVFER